MPASDREECPYTVSSLSARPYTTRVTLPFIRRLVQGVFDVFADRARLQRCIDSAAAQIDVIHIVVDFSESTIFCMPSFARFATVSRSHNLPVLHDDRPNM